MRRNGLAVRIRPLEASFDENEERSIDHNATGCYGYASVA